MPAAAATAAKRQLEWNQNPAQEIQKPAGIRFHEQCLTAIHKSGLTVQTHSSSTNQCLHTRHWQWLRFISLKQLVSPVCTHFETNFLITDFSFLLAQVKSVVQFDLEPGCDCTRLCRPYEQQQLHATGLPPNGRSSATSRQLWPSGVCAVRVPLQ
jgi:hypothetical protein